MHELKQLGISDDTLVLFTSDNGSATGNDDLGCGSNAPLRGGKGSTWEGGMRLPLIARWPKKITAGSEQQPCVQVLISYQHFAP